MGTCGECRSQTGFGCEPTYYADVRVRVEIFFGAVQQCPSLVTHGRGTDASYRPTRGVLNATWTVRFLPELSLIPSVTLV